MNATQIKIIVNLCILTWKLKGEIILLKLRLWCVEKLESLINKLAITNDHNSEKKGR
jgi:hypothetical protein